MRMPEGGRSGPESSAIALLFLLAILLPALLAACVNPEISLGLEAEPLLMPRLKAILAEAPPPEAWKLSTDPPKAAYRLSLVALKPGEKAPPDAALCGTAYYAASVDLCDPRYSVDARQAEEIGFEPLESILPPRRALAIDDAWPGSAAYPFARTLYLSAKAQRGKAIPGEIGRWLRDAAAKAAAADAAPLLLAAVGDMQVGEAQGASLLGGEEGLRSLLDDRILAHLRSADIAVANLESPISSRGQANPRKRYHFRMPSGSSAALKDAGFDLVLFSNNHAFDFGPEAFTDTLKDLGKASLPAVGAGWNADEATRALILETKDHERLAFVGLSFFPKESMGFTADEAAAGASKPGIAVGAEAALASVREAASAGATVVVLAHGGAEYVPLPSEEARRLYARFSEAGAALVLGTHPHLLQGCEARSGSLIAYSLGNFLFTLGDEPPEAWRGAMLDFLLYRGRVRGIIPRPIVAGYYDTKLDAEREAGEARFSRLCAGIGKLQPLTAGR
jgi:poly-gamma-glutamate capsule biosynthesis protein CapA/YwtB (metallophosphatase superfamily)